MTTLLKNNSLRLAGWFILDSDGLVVPVDHSSHYCVHKQNMALSSEEG